MVDKRGAAIVQIAVTKPVVINTTSTHPGTSPRSSDNLRTMRLRWMRRLASIAALVIIDSALLTTFIFVNHIEAMPLGISKITFFCTSQSIATSSANSLSNFLAPALLILVFSFSATLLFIFPLISCLTVPTNLYYINPFRLDNDGHKAKSIDTGKIRNTTGIIIDISALPAAAII